MAVARAHEETEAHDVYDDHAHDEEGADTTTRGGDDGNDVEDDSWSYLRGTALPHPMSDASVAKMKTHEGRSVIVLTGGCNSTNGNELVVEEWGEGFSCKNITSQVREKKLCFYTPLLVYILMLCALSQHFYRHLPLYPNVSMMNHHRHREDHGRVRSRRSRICHVRGIVTAAP